MKLLLKSNEPTAIKILSIDIYDMSILFKLFVEYNIKRGYLACNQDIPVTEVANYYCFQLK